MKKLSILGTVVMLGMMMVTSAFATSMSVEPVAENANSTLTVVFSGPEEFSPIPAPKSAEPVVTKVGSAPVVAEQSAPSASVANVAAVPEPSTLVLLGMGVLGLLGLARRKRK